MKKFSSAVFVLFLFAALFPAPAFSQEEEKPAPYAAEDDYYNDNLGQTGDDYGYDWTQGYDETVDDEAQPKVDE